MDEPCPATVSYPVSACVTANLSGRFGSVNELEQAVLSAVHQAGRELYVQAFRALQEQWLAQRAHRFSAQRWRALQWLTPFGPLALPVRVVREKSSGNISRFPKWSCALKPRAVFLRRSKRRLARRRWNRISVRPPARFRVGSARAWGLGWSGRA